MAASTPPALVRLAQLTLDLDPAGLASSRLAQTNGQHSIGERRVDLVRVDVCAQRNHVVELPDLAGLPPQDADTLLLLDLAGDPQLVVPQFEIDVFGLNSGKIDLDDESVVGLLDVGQRCPTAPRESQLSGLAEEALHELSHPVVDVLHRLERVAPALRALQSRLRRAGGTGDG